MATNKTLFQITGELQILEQVLDDFDGDITDAEKEARIDAVLQQFAENDAEFADKLDSYVYLIADFESRKEFRLAESKRLYALAKQDETNEKRLRLRLKESLKLLNRTDFQTKLHKFKVAKVGGKLPMVLDNNYTGEIADEFMKTIPEQRVIDNDAVREFLEAGNTLEFAKLEQRGDTLKIK